ncbi:ScbR family autoregulator-binding transcription factor [Streptomyces sp. DG2A-72]|uniref:ScbR family autoregulator-binding transcription factor n=1 Tax=Streptomyces sp. DG2A-72 TaxID=3051386 RepID=UPI00265BCF0B|nr:ScbR family autoregulator-binding transcription factor [Streptomyces sp. DG2A-72]MDO0939455.1 ScbR family autoregulator-binding transcription factor [Streptomyces sp. DG2A-72]
MVKQERAVRTRHALIQAAAAVFAEEGFVTASLSTISGRAGVSNGALHFHFASKNRLAEAVRAQAAEALGRITETARARHGDSLQTVVDATHELMDSLARDIVVRGGFELAGDAARRGGPSLRRQWQRWVEDSLRRAERSGALAQGVSAADGARVIVAATAGFEILGGEDVSWLSRRSVTRFWEVLLPLLAGRQNLDGLVCAGSNLLTAVPRRSSPRGPAPQICIPRGLFKTWASVASSPLPLEDPSRMPRERLEFHWRSSIRPARGTHDLDSERKRYRMRGLILTYRTCCF